MMSDFYLLAFSLAIACPALVLLFFILKLVAHSRRIKMRPGAGGLIGLRGRAHSEISNEGLVFVRGEIWPARSTRTIQPGEKVRVVSFFSLGLEVEAE
jgi:membrane-bound ClpP family serine protease